MLDQPYAESEVPVLPPRETRLRPSFAGAVATLDRVALASGCRSWVQHTPGLALRVGRPGPRRPLPPRRRAPRHRSLALHARCFGRSGHSFVFYEDLVHHPRRELARLTHECGLHPESGTAAEAVERVDVAPPR